LNNTLYGQNLEVLEMERKCLPKIQKSSPLFGASNSLLQQRLNLIESGKRTCTQKKLNKRND